MKKTILFLSIGLLLSTPILAETKCFLAKENHKVIKQEGDCNSRHSPCSTFKIPLSLMGFDAGILIPILNGHLNPVTLIGLRHGSNLIIQPIG